MSDGPQMVFAFPRPGPALKVILVTLAAVGVLDFLIVNWIPGGDVGASIFMALVCTKHGVMHGQIWRLLTAGLLTKPGGQGAISHLLFTLMGLYFLSPDLERRWGSARFVRFLLTAVGVGYLLAIAVDLVATGQAEIFHPPLMFGAGAAIAATAIAWARENAELQVRLFFFIPAKGKHLFWFTILYCVLGVISKDTFTEGAGAPFGGVVVGLLLGGSPSVVRTLYLQAKLAFIKRRSGHAGATAAIRGVPRRPRPGSPPLRVVQGGMEDELRKRQPPKDKRYLN